VNKQMIGRLPKKYRHKYTKELNWDEALVYFAVKAVGGVVVFFMFALGVDVYYL